MLLAMPQPDIDALDRFFQRHAPALEKIVRFSRGLTSLCELHSDAWLVTLQLSDELERSIDLDFAEDAEKLLKKLRQGTDKQIRESRRLHSCDAPIAGEDSPSLASTLIGDDGDHPLTLLEAFEELADNATEPDTADAYYSESAAWHWLAIRFDHRMRDIAAWLMISRSWCWQIRHRARNRLQRQWQLPHAMEVGEDEHALRPWRKFKLPARLPPAQAQLTLNLRATPAQPPQGQMWLL